MIEKSFNGREPTNVTYKISDRIFIRGDELIITTRDLFGVMNEVIIVNLSDISGYKLSYSFNKFLKSLIFIYLALVLLSSNFLDSISKLINLLYSLGFILVVLSATIKRELIILTKYGEIRVSNLTDEEIDLIISIIETVTIR